MAKIIWIVLLIVFIWIEAETVSLVSLWFAFGAVAALIAELCGGGIDLQILLFFVVSAGTLLLLRPVTRRFFTPKLEKTNIDALIGSTGVVTMDIKADLSQGQVKLGGMDWTARSTTGEEIPAGTKVFVDKIEGVKVFVTPCHAEITNK